MVNITYYIKYVDKQITKCIKVVSMKSIKIPDWYLWNTKYKIRNYD
jgi:hypothetical protein